MRRNPRAKWSAVALQVGGLAWAAAANEPAPVDSSRVQLPPMLVEESTASVPWFYVQAGGTEFLSRCSAGTTRALAEAWLEKLQLVRVLVPEEFLARMDVPSVFVLYAQDLQQTVSAEIQRELQGREAKGGGGRGDGFNIAPSMRLADRDMHASIAYIDEALFDAATLSISPSHVRYLINGRVPVLPTWLGDGVERLLRGVDFVQAPVSLRPLIWLSEKESDALAWDGTRPRALLPASELFAAEAARAAEKQHPRRAAVRASTEELFLRWAITTGSATRAALWRFAARAAEEPVTEELFEANFGFDFAELRDRLSDFLPKAVRETARLAPGRQPPLPTFTVELATPNQVARVRGEWERLAIGHVQRRLPAAREPYVAQARRTLRRAYDAGDRDPRLLATMGLCEIDAGNPAGARPYLEPAVAAGVVRPRAYHELARLRFADLRRDGSEAGRLTFTELAPVFGPLRRALTQAPPLPEVYGLLADAWARCETAPTAAELAELLEGARLFGRKPAVGVPIARALARHGRRAEAAAVLATADREAADDESRTAVSQLRAELAATAGAGGEEAVVAKP